MYARTQETIDAILTRNLENTAESSPALLHYNFSHSGTPPQSTFRVHFTYENGPIKTFDGRKWN